jgi:predicted enzyme related to lactoylglutathione lyase
MTDVSSAAPAVPGWFDISTPDSKRARDFYQKMFGWQINALDDNYALLGGEGGAPAAGMGTAGPDAPYTGIVVYFPVSDIDAAYERATKELGGGEVLAPTETPLGRMAVFTDPDGNKVGLMTPIKPPGA